MTRWLIIFSLSQIFFCAHSQVASKSEVQSIQIQRKLDSLRAVAREAHGNRKAHLLNEIALLLPTEEALVLYDRVINESTDSVILARAIYNKAGRLSNSMRKHEAEEVLASAIPAFEHCREAEEYLDGMYSAYARIKIFKGEYSSAFENFYKSVNLVRKRRDSVMLGHLMIDIGMLHYKVRNNTKALELSQAAMKLLPEDASVQFNGYLNSGLCLAEMGFLELALQYCDSAFSRTTSRDKYLLHAEFARGFILLKLGRTSEARRFFSSSLNLCRRVNDGRMEADNLLYLAKSWLAESHVDSALRILHAAEAVAKKNDTKEILIDIYRTGISISNQKSNQEELAEFQKKYIALKQYVYTIGLERSLASLEGDWLEHQNNQLIAFQEAELDEREKATSYHKAAIIVLDIIALLVFSIVGLYLRGLYLHWQAQRFLKVQVKDRFNRLHMGVTSRARSTVINDHLPEFRRRIGQVCQDMAALMDANSHAFGSKPVAKHFDEIVSTYLKEEI